MNSILVSRPSGLTRSTLFGSRGVLCDNSFSRQSMRRISLVIEAAHKKGSGSTKNGRDSNSKRRGVKVYGGQAIFPGQIIIRQLGTKFHPGVGVGMGKDYTLFAKAQGVVMFENIRGRSCISVLPNDNPKVLAKVQQPNGNGKGHPTRKERKKMMYKPREVQRKEALGAEEKTA
eukprot:TRINITY_DN850_c0_g1_i3.p1 TRINITY_DN850_c0_g1~~TRINITY_DN850_c0_g1_i3.p1  ORF type:complete len:190 (-),score=9.56 TRINITY_DN850_c0_g1_i3:187-708(-)